MKTFTKSTIHSTVIIGDNVQLGDKVTIGAYTIIHDNVRIGDGTTIGAQCILGEPLADCYGNPQYVNPPLTVGDNTIIRSGTIIYAGSQFGSDFETGHRVTIREGTTTGNHVRIGTLSDIQGHCELGNYVRLHSNVHIGQKSKIGHYVWIFPYTVLTNDPHPPSNQLIGVTIDDFAVIATMVVILPGVHVGQDALIGAMANVREDVAPGAVVVGNPAKQVTTVDQIKNRFTGSPVYPWREHFGRGMPWEELGYEKWLLADHVRIETK